MESERFSSDLFERELRNKSDHMVAMNFKVSFEFRQAMKLYALRHGLSLRAVFIMGFQTAALGLLENSEYPQAHEANHPSPIAAADSLGRKSV